MKCEMCHKGEAKHPLYTDDKGSEIYVCEECFNKAIDTAARACLEDVPEEEGEPEGEAEAMSISGPIDSESDFETVQQLQLKLYSLGYLSPDVEEGVLDEQTLQAVAEFQTRKNEKEDAGFDVVDPGDLSSVVDAATVRAIFES